MGFRSENGLNKIRFISATRASRPSCLGEEPKCGGAFTASVQDEGVDQGAQGPSLSGIGF
jgi:hypothetical protein